MKKHVRFQGAVWQVLSEVPTPENGLVYNLYRVDPAGKRHWSFAKARECVEVQVVAEQQQQISSNE